MRLRTLVLTTAAFTLLGVTNGEAQRKLGSIDFPNSGAPEAQAPFIQGVLLLHSFEFGDAATEFQRAQELDPDFALAYWGEAMTYNHPLWRQQDRDAALAALARYAPTPDARAQKAGNAREAGYLDALALLYGSGSKTERDVAYMDAMGRLSAAHPDDLEARAFYSLAILGSTDGERDFATYMRAAAVAQVVFEANPNHPGGAHYIIHSFDDPVHAPLGLKAARAYSEIAPNAGHAQHMTSHIFVAMGMWDDVVAANIRARNEQNGRNAELGGAPNPCGHYTSWLHYGWLQKGMIEDAERGMDECRERVLAGGSRSEVGYFVGMRARHVLDLGDWGAADRLSADIDRPGYHFITGFAAIKRGDRAAAESALGRLGAPGSSGGPRVEIMRSELSALIEFDAGHVDAAITQLEEAAALEESLPFEFGPPASLQPPHELLASMYLLGERPADAARLFRKALSFTPERTGALVGLAAAASDVGDAAAAQDALNKLESIWSQADASFLERFGIAGGSR